MQILTQDPPREDRPTTNGDFEADAPMTARQSARTCAGCRLEVHKREALRFVRAPNGELVPDWFGKLGGRGASIHKDLRCLEKALRGGFSRQLRSEVKIDIATVLERVETQVALRLQGYVLTALRTRSAALGADAVLQAIYDEKAILIVATHDASDRPHAHEAAAERGVRVVRFGTKESLGALAGRSELGLMAITDKSIAAEVERAIDELHDLQEGK